MTQVLKIKKIGPGYYEIRKADLKGRIFRFEEGNWKGWWMMDWEDGSYSDPFPTKRDAVDSAKKWGGIDAN